MTERCEARNGNCTNQATRFVFYFCTMCGEKERDSGTLNLCEMHDPAIPFNLTCRNWSCSTAFHLQIADSSDPESIDWWLDSGSSAS